MYFTTLGEPFLEGGDDHEHEGRETNRPGESCKILVLHEIGGLVLGSPETGPDDDDQENHSTHALELFVLPAPATLGPAPWSGRFRREGRADGPLEAILHRGEEEEEPKKEFELE